MRIYLCFYIHYLTSAIH